MSLHKVTPSDTTNNQEVKKVEFEVFDSNFNPNAGWCLLVYGKFGGGKTWFAGTAQDSLYINTGHGEDTLKSPEFLRQYPDIRRKTKDIVHQSNYLAYDQVCDITQQVLDDPQDIKTVILDDSTAFRSMAMLHGMKSMNKNIIKFNDIGMDDIKREMNRVTWFFEQCLPLFKSKGINFILLAHEARIYGKASKMGEERPLIEIRPGFSGEKFPDAVPSKFDEVWYIELKEAKGKYFSQIKTGGGGSEITRTRRAGVFARYEMNKSFEQLLEQRRLNQLHPSYLR
jgi:hypothetical protein